MSLAWRFAVGGLVGMTLLASCGDDDEADPAEPTSAAAESPSTESADTAAPSTDGGGDDPYGPGPVDDTTAATGGETDPTGGATTDADVALGETDLGEVLVNAEGLTLYGFTNDAEGEPTCFDECAGTWPPAIVDGEPSLGDLDGSVFTVVEHPEGSQLKAGDWPLYTFASDAAPGDVNGQGVGGVWFAVTPDGELITDDATESS